MTELEHWLYCPICNDGRVNVQRSIGDRGGIEMLKLECEECHEVKTVIP